MTHPAVGELTLDWDTFRYGGAPEQQLVPWSADRPEHHRRRRSQRISRQDAFGR
ncbi:MULTISPECIES: hypothetical protein [unclassified Streptomyces]|uniref:hypothetical protein n=1 Tax=unclassified Streptomyces TaxID=2593676 RepID=UPI0022A870DF|nr:MULTISPECIES: hypothetical protein [unclassified Streptomyces]WKE73647.1 hypothetical protein QHG49_00045 [Streptomyces sp. WP-1]